MDDLDFVCLRMDENSEQRGAIVDTYKQLNWEIKGEKQIFVIFFLS